MSGPRPGIVSPHSFRQCPPRAGAPIKVRWTKKIKTTFTTADSNPFTKSDTTRRSPPAALTPPAPASSVRGVEEGPGLSREQLESDGSGFESIEDGQMEEAIAKLTEVVIGQADPAADGRASS